MVHIENQTFLVIVVVMVEAVSSTESLKCTMFSGKALAASVI